MKSTVDFTVSLEKFEDLEESLKFFSWDYLDNLQFGFTQVGTYGDIRIALELMKYVNKQFENVLVLRSENPDLKSQYDNLFKVMADKKKEMDDVYKLLVTKENL